jgi:hypothetical protein
MLVNPSNLAAVPELISFWIATQAFSDWNLIKVFETEIIMKKITPLKNKTEINAVRERALRILFFNVRLFLFLINSVYLLSTNHNVILLYKTGKI